MRKVSESEMREWGPQGEDLEWFILMLKFLHLKVFVDYEDCEWKYMCLMSEPNPGELKQLTSYYSSAELRPMFEWIVKRMSVERGQSKQCGVSEVQIDERLPLRAPVSTAEMKMKLELMGRET